MTPKEAYKIWAPSGRKWVDWVRPVPFVQINECEKKYSSSELEIKETEVLLLNNNIFSSTLMNEGTKSSAVIVDLPGAESVKMGLELAMLGFRPVPVYNGTIEQRGACATVDNQSVCEALIAGADILKNMEIEEDAPPAFLTDKNRLNRFKMNISVFDNSYDMYHQDFPTAEYFLKNGINKILIISSSFSVDLKIIFYEFQKKNMEFYLAGKYKGFKKVRISKRFGKKKD